MAGRFSVEAVFKAVDRVTRPVSRMQNRVGKFTRSMSRGFNKLNRTVDKFSANVKRGAIATAAALAITAGAMANVLGAGVEFEQTLVNAAAKFPGEIRKGTKAFKELGAAAKEVGATTEFTATQSAQALNFLAMAGFNAESSITALPGVVDLATAAQVDLATATDIATDSLGAFNLITKDTEQLGKNLARVNDVIAKTATSANTTVEDLFEAFKEGGPVATTAGASIETFSALVGELANAGIKGGRAGTTLKNMFLKLASPTAKGAKLLKTFGVETADANGDMRDIVDIIGDLNKSLDGLGTAQRTGVLEGIFGRIPIAGVNILLASGAKKLDTFRKSLEGASGASGRMAAMMRDTTRGSLNALNSAVEGVKISIFDLSKGPLKDAIDKTTDWVRANNDLIAQNIGGFIADLITNFEEIVQTGKKIIGVIVAYMALVVALKLAAAASIAFKIVSIALTATMAILKGAMLAYQFIVAGLPKILALARIAILALNIAFAANPVGLVIIAITAFIALAATVITAWDPVTEFFSDLWGSIKDVISGIGGALKKFGEFFGFTDAPEVKAPEVPEVDAPTIKAATTPVIEPEVKTPEVPEARTPRLTLVPKAPVDQANLSVTPAVADITQQINNVVPEIIAQASNDDEFDNVATTGAEPQIVSPQERVARSIEERRETKSAEITIKPEVGVSAEVTQGQLGNNIKLQRSGSF